MWEAPARGVVIRDKDEVREAYMKLFQSMNVHTVTHQVDQLQGSGQAGVSRSPWTAMLPPVRAGLTQ